MATLKQSTAYNRMVFMVSSSDHVTGKTGLTLTITASKGGAAFGSISPTVTERGNGWYVLALTTSHTDTVGDLAFHITGTAADPCDFVDQVTTQLLSDIPTAAVTAAAVWDLTLTGHDTANTFGGIVQETHTHADSMMTAFEVNGDVYDLTTSAVKNVWEVAKASHNNSGTFGKMLQTDLGTQILTTALTESYATDGSTGTLTQLLYMIYACVGSYYAEGTTIHALKLDGATDALIFTTDSSTSPTSRNRSS